MTRLTRLKYAVRFIRSLAGTAHFEKSKSWFVAQTYGVLTPDGNPDAELIKRIKAKYRNELSYGGGK